MRIVPLTDETVPDWRRIADEARESWFWHTPEWLAFVKAVGGDFFVGEFSSLIYVDRDPVAICPVILEDRGGYRRFTYLGEFLPFPALRADASESLRAKVVQHYADWLDGLAAQHDVAYTRVIVPTLADCASGHDVMPWNPLLRHGYLDLPGASQIVSLAQDEASLWRDIRKGHRSDIKRGMEQCELSVWDASTITPAKFDEYRTLHAIDAGRVTRRPETFDMMFEWVRTGHAILVEASRGQAPVAFALVIVFRDGAYYASACKHPDADVPAMHAVQWEAIRWLKAHGIQRYDLGMQYFGPRWDHLPSQKELSIASFKRGFGGTTRRVDFVEKFYSTSVMAQVFAERTEALMASREQHVR